MPVCLLLFFLLGNASAGDPVAGKVVASRCVACHGMDGASNIPTFPRLAGQQDDYILKQLLELKSGVRPDPIMSGIAKALQPKEAQDVAAYMGTTPPVSLPQPAVPAADVEHGRDLYLRGDRTRAIPACQACHGADGRGGKGVNGVVVPSVAGQHAAYTTKQLTAFKNHTRTNDFGSMMQYISGKLDDADITAVSNYLATILAPQPIAVVAPVAPTTPAAPPL